MYLSGQKPRQCFLREAGDIGIGKEWKNII